MNKITYEERKNIYEAAIEKWGVEAQTIVAIEEMSELTKEICKGFRGQGDKEKLADEIADVTIMLEQLRLMFGLNETVSSHMDMKIRRLQERVGMTPGEKEQIHPDWYDRLVELAYEYHPKEDGKAWYRADDVWACIEDNNEEGRA